MMFGYAIVPKQLEGLKTALISISSHTYSCAPAPMQAALETGLRGRDEQKKRGTTIPVFLQEGEREMRSHGNSSSPSLPLAGKQVSCPSLVLQEFSFKCGIDRCKQQRQKNFTKPDKRQNPAICLTSSQFDGM